MSDARKMQATVYVYAGPNYSVATKSRHRIYYENAMEQQQEQQRQQQLAVDILAFDTVFSENQETFNVLCFHGIPYNATNEDLVAFLSFLPAYRRADLGKYGNGTCSGCAFVELCESMDREAVSKMPQRPFLYAKHATMPVRSRESPRYADVLGCTKEVRDVLLEYYRTLSPANPRVKKAAKDKEDGGSPFLREMHEACSWLKRQNLTTGSTSSAPTPSGLPDSQRASSSSCATTPHRLPSSRQHVHVQNPPPPPPQLQERQQPASLSASQPDIVNPFYIFSGPQAPHARVPHNASFLSDNANSFASSPRSGNYFTAPSSSLHGDSVNQSQSSRSPGTNAASVMSQPSLPSMQQPQTQQTVYLPYTPQTTYSHQAYPQPPC